MMPYTFYDELYAVTYHLFVNKSQNYINNFVKKEYKVDFALDISSIDGCCCEVSSSKGYAILIILNLKFDNSPHALATLTHETYHAVEFVLRDRGVASNKSTSEAWAYYLSYLMEKFLTYLNSRRRRAK